MKNMKKILALRIATLLILSLCACGNSAENDTTSTGIVNEQGSPGGMPPDGQGGPGGAPGGSSSAEIEYSGAAEITSADTQSTRTYASTTPDESALLISTSDDVTINDPTVSKSGSSDGGDSYVSEFNGSAANVISNGYTLYVNGTALTGTN